MNEWIGFGRLVRFSIHPYFMIVQLTPALVRSLKRIAEQVANVGLDDVLENVSISASSAYYDETSREAFVVPTSEWKTIGKIAAQKMWSNQSVLIRVSQDHADFLKLSSIDQYPAINFEVNAEDETFDVCATISKDDGDAAELIYAYNALQKDWVIAWAERGIAGCHGQTLYEAIENPEAPAVREEQQGQTENPPPPPPPTPPAEEEEAEEEGEEEEEHECDCCGSYFPQSELVEDLCSECRGTCTVCNQIVMRDDMYEDETVCDNCAVRCTDCDEFYHPRSIVDGVCITCRNEYYSTCVTCNRLTTNDDMVGEVCMNCAVRCAGCEDYFAPSQLNADSLCVGCADTMSRCSDCSEFWPNNELTEDGACPDCAVGCSFCDSRFKSANLNEDGLCGDCIVHTALCADCGDRYEMTDLNAGMLCSECERKAHEENEAAIATTTRRRRRRR